MLSYTVTKTQAQKCEDHLQKGTSNIGYFKI